MGLVSNLTSNAPDGLSLTNITEAINQYVVSPVALFGVAGFVFSAEGEARADISADITDHYTEDNLAIQDQIAIHPERLTLKGYVGEVVYTATGSTSGVIAALAEKLVAISAFLPTLSSAAQQIQTEINNSGAQTLQATLSNSANIYGLIQNLLGAFGQYKNQRNAYNYFKALCQSKTLMSIQSPWEFMTNMAIEHVTPLQSENTRWITEFAVSFKRIRIAQTTNGILSNASAIVTGGATVPAQASGAAAIQSSEITQNGLVPGASTSISITDLPNLTPDKNSNF